jgi:outer membrane protein assembly factor BamB
LKDQIFVASYDGKIYCLKPQNGEVVWSSDDGGFEPVTIQDDIVYTSTSDGRVVALDANSGKKVWEKKLHNTVATAPQFFRGLLIYGEWEGDLVAVDSRNGQDVARYSTGRGITSKPIVDRDAEVAYVMTKNGDLYASQMGRTNSLEQWAWEKSWY